MTAPAAHPSLDRYFQEAASLRLCLQYNAEDYEFARDGRIVYLMDANVVRFFMDPLSEVGHVLAFGPGEADSSYAVGTAVVTAEFLFSRDLAGQRGSPALIAPGHGEDIQDIIAGLAKAPGLEAPKADPIGPEGTVELRRLLDRVAAGGISRGEAVARLRDLVPNTTRALLAEAFQAATQLLRLYNEDLIRPLASDPAATRDVMLLEGAAALQVDAWERRLRAEHRGAARRTDGRAGRRIRRDAEALVQAMALDRQAGASLRFVMVTADRVLFDAYARWYWAERRGEEPGARFLLRVPLQYAPILNVIEMPNGIAASPLLARARDTLDTLFAALRDVDGDYPHSLAVHRILARGKTALHDTLRKIYGFNPLELDPGEVQLFEAIGREWREGFRSGVVLNAELMTRRMQAEFGRLARMLREDTELRDAIHEDQQRVMGDVEQLYLSYGVGINLRLLAEGGDARARRTVRRAPLPLRVAFPRVLESRDLDGALESLAAGDAELRREVKRALRVLDAEAFCFAACVAHRCGLWHAAWHYTGRALDLLPPAEQGSAAHAELVYLRASSARYALPGEAAVAEALASMAQLAERARAEADAFGRARALCERAAMLLVVLYAAALLGDHGHASLPELPAGEVRLAHDIGEAADAVAAASQGSSPTDSAQLDWLALQAAANAASAELYARILAPDRRLAASVRPPPAVLASAQERLEQLQQAGMCPPIVAAELEMLRADRGEVAPAAAAAALRAIVAQADATGAQLTELDRAEFRAFERRLTARIAPPLAAMAASA